MTFSSVSTNRVRRIIQALASRAHHRLVGAAAKNDGSGNGPAWGYYWSRLVEDELAPSCHGDPVRFLESLAIAGPIRVLSLRSGTCALEIDMARRFRLPYEITCTGSDSESFAAAREIAAAEEVRLTFQEVAPELSALPGSSFHLVLASAALHDVTDLERVLEQIAGSLAPGGLLNLIDIDGRVGSLITPEAVSFASGIMGLLPADLALPGRAAAPVPRRELDARGRPRILPLLAKRFEPVLEVRHGAFIRFLCQDTPVGRLSPEVPRQKAWLDFLIDVDRSVVRRGLLDPLEIWGLYRLRPRDAARPEGAEVQLVVAGQPADAPRVHAETMPSVAGESQGGARRFDPTTDPPSVLFLSMSTSNLCNFRCKHCHIWMNDDAANELSTQERVEVIRQFSRLGNGGTVVLPGGEVTMDCDELFALSGACRELGLGCAITTNGSAIVTPDFATRIASSGITAITVSLDGHRRELHEYTRGIPGCFDTTVRALRLLVEARRRSGSPLQVMASCVVFDRNVEVLEEYVEFCRELGLDHVDLQMLSRTFSNRHPRRDVFFERHFWWDEESKKRAKEALRGVIENSSREAGFLLKGVESLDWIFSYIEDPDFRTSRPICGSHERNLVVSTRGDVSLCFNAAQIFSEPAVGNIRESTLAEIWRGRQSQEYRLVMDVCRLNCGALNCHRRRESPLS